MTVLWTSALKNINPYSPSYNISGEKFASSLVGIPVMWGANSLLFLWRMPLNVFITMCCSFFEIFLLGLNWNSYICIVMTFTKSENFSVIILLNNISTLSSFLKFLKSVHWCLISHKFKICLLNLYLSFSDFIILIT